ncbi:MAG TPA: hypothetical protein VJU14_10560 [Solirubrobacterales bacterium]|nr:hypothetical protein [Solirubrobacterales bacterium]
MVHFRNKDLEPHLLNIATHALGDWAPEADIHVSSIGPGLSEAALLRVDISGEAGDLAGVHILKVARGDGGPRQSRSGEERALSFAKEFGEFHVPKVLRHWSGTAAEEAAGSALLIEIAGGSLRRYATPTRSGSEPLRKCIERLVDELAEAWTDLSDVRSGSIREFIVGALGKEGTEEAFEVAAEFFGVGGFVGEHGHTFLSPSSLLGRPADERFIGAFQHGDLHTGNLILPLEPAPDNDAFWLIDFDRAGESMFGLDFAYLELSILCDFYGDLSGSSLATVLNHVEDPQHRGPVPDDLQWLAEIMRSSRKAITAFGETTAGRTDDLERQMIIARITEALRWARRHRGRKRSHLALYYAGWYVAHLERLQGQSEGAAAPVTGGGGGPTEQPLEGPALEAWEGLWNDAGHFARRDWTYILIAERLGDEAALGAVGNLPLSGVVDLDPSSDNDGLFTHAGPVLASTRAVHVFSQDMPIADYKRGTVWLMSAGWRLRQEPAVDFRTWNRTRLRHVRNLFEAIRQQNGNSPVCVLALPGQHDAGDAAGDVDRLVRVLETADEVWQGAAALHVVSDAKLHHALPFTQHPFAAADCVRQLATVFGAEESVTQYRLPSGSGGTIAIEQDRLQAMREYFEVLHDRVASVGGDEEGENDAFWRGGQILWSDLAEERDVPRDVGPELTRAILDSLENHRTHTVVLHHKPGAGGTTAALRAAWEVHRDFPVAILRPGQAVDHERIRFLAERLHRLFVLTEKPVLLVADAADLPEANRERLYRELASRRARITLLYVRRSLSLPEGALAVSEPLSDAEAADFLARFRQLTEDPKRIAELEMLSMPPFEQYRIPFFYGLTTFQREFTKVGDYVSHYLRGVAGPARDVLAHLAFVSKYSNSGLQLGLVQRLFRLDADAGQLAIEDLLGPAAALVVRRAGRYRIAHPLLADKLLAHITGTEDWHEHLRHIALDFIEDVSALGDTGSDPVRTLLRQIFIARGGAEGVDDRGAFAPVIDDLDAIDYSVGHGVLRELTMAIPDEPHFWNHLGRHQIYRLRRDYDKAEDNLEHAILLSPNDALHHHTLGLARRARLREGLRTGRGQGTEAIMAVIEAHFERTVDCFRKSRSLIPDDVYGYTTHVQTILQAAEALQEAADVKTVARLPAGAIDWTVEQMTIANTLLDDASELYGTLDRQDDYLHRCLVQIEELYGDLDEVIDLWEERHAEGHATPYSRRALAQAYLMRANRRWRALSTPELNRIAELAKDNLGRSTARDEDFRLWFEASKLLSDFEVEDALAHLELWAGRVRSWRAAYYRYVLHFMLWLLERSNDPSSFEEAQEECVELVPGRLDQSPVWLGKDPAWCPLVADSDLGEWDRSQRFWHDTSLLRRVNGVIDFVDGLTAGQVLIGTSGVRAFFVPGIGGFMAQADENVPVNFFLGFSPSGLRAWDVRRGHAPDAISRGGKPLEMPALVSRPRETNYEEIQRERTGNLRTTRVRELVQSFAEAALGRSDAVALKWIEERVLATLGVGSSDLVSEERLRRMVMVMEGVRIEEREEGLIATRSRERESAATGGNGLVVGFVSHYDSTTGLGRITRNEGDSLRFSAEDLHPESPTEIKRNAVVRFLPSRDRRTEQALEVQLLSEATLFEGRVIRADELTQLVDAEITRILEEGSAAGGRPGIEADRLEDHLRRAFRGAHPLERRLGENGLRAFLRKKPWLVVRGQKGDQVVELVDTLGRSHEPSGSTSSTTDAPADDVRAAVRAAYARLRGQHPYVTVPGLGQELDRTLGSEGYAKFIGSRGPRRSLEALGEWEMARVDGRLEIWPKAGAGAPSGADERVAGNGSGDPRELVRSAVARIQQDRGQVTLQVLGQTLLKDLGEEGYEDLIGTKGLKRTIEGLGEWKLRTVRPSLVVLEPIG